MTICVRAMQKHSRLFDVCRQNDDRSRASHSVPPQRTIFRSHATRSFPNNAPLANLIVTTFVTCSAWQLPVLRWSGGWNAANARELRRLRFALPGSDEE